MKKILLMALLACGAVSVSFGQVPCQCQNDCVNNHKSKGYDSTIECINKECKPRGILMPGCGHVVDSAKEIK